MDQLTICNMALSRINQRKIADIDETSGTGAPNCKLFYDQVRKAALRSYNFSFSKATAELVVTVDTPLLWAYEYDKPDDCLRVRRVLPECGESLVPTFVGDEMIYAAKPGSSYKTPYEIIGDKICTNLEDAYCEYTVDVEDADLFDDLFVRLFYTTLARDICMPVTGKLALYKGLVEEVRMIQVEARGISAKENHVPQDRSGDLVSARK